MIRNQLSITQSIQNEGLLATALWLSCLSFEEVAGEKMPLLLIYPVTPLIFVRKIHSCLKLGTKKHRSYEDLMAAINGSPELSLLLRERSYKYRGLSTRALHLALHRSLLTIDQELRVSAFHHHIERSDLPEEVRKKLNLAAAFGRTLGHLTPDQQKFFFF